MKTLRFLFVAALLAAVACPAGTHRCWTRATVNWPESARVNLQSTYGGKVLLVVNTASKCGFTPQYEALEAMHARL
jgi:glutathione peroxidase